MNLPIESPEWRDEFREKIALERAVLKTLIQWGLTESAFDIQKAFELRFQQTMESETPRKNPGAFRLPEEEKARFGEMLRDAYLRTREVPRQRSCQELLHSALLTGFAELTGQLVHLYEQHLERQLGPLVKEQAA